jgi:origin recognition complex subunit 2
MAKRQRDEDEGDTPVSKRVRRTAFDDEVAPAETPSKRKSILRGTPTRANGGIKDVGATPTTLKKVLFSTPKKHQSEDENGIDTPTAARNDRSARRKSANHPATNGRNVSELV